MELTDDNLLTLSEYLKHTLSPDVNVRRPGEYNLSINQKFLIENILYNPEHVYVFICKNSLYLNFLFNYFDHHLQFDSSAIRGNLACGYQQVLYFSFNYLKNRDNLALIKSF